jgi:hypothetical protein
MLTATVRPVGDKGFEVAIGDRRSVYADEGRALAEARRAVGTGGGGLVELVASHGVPRDRIGIAAYSSPSVDPAGRRATVREVSGVGFEVVFGQLVLTFEDVEEAVEAARSQMRAAGGGVIELLNDAGVVWDRIVVGAPSTRPAPPAAATPSSPNPRA